MRVVIVGASGMIGHSMAVALAQRGVALLCLARDPVRTQAKAPAIGALPNVSWARVDWGASGLAPASWGSLLRKDDVVVNAAGILREARPGDFEAVHHRGPAQLFAACAARGVRRVIHLSALGATPDASTGYFVSKGRGDAALRRTAVPSVIVKPSLVWADRGVSASVFATLAVLPIVALPAAGRQMLQPVHIDDLVDALVELVIRKEAAPPELACVGARPATLREYLASLRSQLGFLRPAVVLSVPAALFRSLAAVAGLRRNSLLDRDAAQMLMRGSSADARPLEKVLGRPPRDHSTFVSPATAAQVRQGSLLSVTLPLLRLSVAAVWIWTFVVSIGLYPRDQSLRLLAGVGAQGRWAELLLTGAAMADLALGVATLALGAAARARWLWPMQLLLIGFYTAVITVALPEHWLHPFGPLSKNMPMAAAIALMWALDLPGASPHPNQAKRI